MRYQVPLAAALITLSLSLSSCQQGRSAEITNNPPAASSSPAPEPAQAANTEPVQLKGPNAIPKDTRIVVNIPAFRMDIFRQGSLLKSYKIGIGYPQFPLPTGFRKAEMIIFNPTWTQPNESWASNPGEVVPAGASGNPLGPIKVPIGGANLIHGGKDLWKIGTFASHGCVGLTNGQVKDFAKVLAEATDTELKEDTMARYLKRRSLTQVVKLARLVPVELRYETIVIEDGKLHIYRDVYNKKGNTEENLRAVFEVNGLNFDAVGSEEKARMLEALDVMSGRVKKPATLAPTPVANQTKEEKLAAAAARKAEADRVRALRAQKEIVIDVSNLSGKGYPGPVNLNTGTEYLAKSTDVTATLIAPKPKRPRRNPTPALQPTPEAVPSPRSIADPR
jgi:lipoprotein-anchoring transpeptidase ErfK/SrfK